MSVEVAARTIWSRHPNPKAIDCLWTAHDSNANERLREFLERPGTGARSADRDERDDQSSALFARAPFLNYALVRLLYRPVSDQTEPLRNYVEWALDSGSAKPESLPIVVDAEHAPGVRLDPVRAPIVADQKSTAVDYLAHSLRRVGQIGQEYRDLLDRCVRGCVFFDWDGKTRRSNSSISSAPGVFLTDLRMARDEQLIEEEISVLAEILVHENAHSLLGLIDDISPLCSGIGTVFSPWKGTERPLLNALHAVVAFGRVAMYRLDEAEVTGSGRSDGYDLIAECDALEMVGRLLHEKGDALSPHAHMVLESLLNDLLPKLRYGGPL